MRTPRPGFAAILLVPLAFVDPVALAQPGPPDRHQSEPGQRRPGRMGDRPDLFEPQALKARLERRLEELKREQARIQTTLDRLAKGEKPEDVMQDIGPGRRPRPEEGGPLQERRPGPPDGQGEGRPDAARAPLTDDERGEILSLLREHMPRVAEKIESAMKDNPQQGQRMIGRWAPRARELLQLRHRDEKLFRLRVDEMREGWSVLEAAREARDLARTEHDNEAGIGEKRTTAGNALRAALSRQFDARLAMQVHEVDALSARIDELKKQIDEQRSARDTRISEAAERIMKAPGPAQGEEGDAPNPPDGQPPRRPEPR